jgi:hypothetical protein
VGASPGTQRGGRSLRRFTGEYAKDGKQTRRAAREAAGNKCIRCGHPNDFASGHVLTTHHFDGNKANDEWWNLMALCQRCHLKVQGKVDPRIPFFLEHSDWMKPYVAGFYAHKYEGRNITRAEAMSRMGELLSYEFRAGGGGGFETVSAEPDSPNHVIPEE